MLNWPLDIGYGLLLHGVGELSMPTTPIFNSQNDNNKPRRIEDDM